MDFTRLTDGLGNVSELPDVPALSEGWTPERLKAQFDKAALSIGVFINDVLLPELEADAAGASGSEKIGSAPIGGLEGMTVRSQLVSLRQFCGLLESRIREVSAGSIPDGTIGLSKLTPEVAQLISRIYTATLCAASFTEHGIYTFTVPRSGLYRIRAVGAGSAGNLVNPNGTYTGAFSGTGGFSGAYAEALVGLIEGDVLELTVGQGGETISGITVGQEFTLPEYADYVNQCVYSGAGGSTSVQITSVGTILCAGADPDSEPARASFSNTSGQTGFDAPIGVRGDSTPNYGSGKDSRLGQGGGGLYVPGMGAGGGSGRLYYSADEIYTVRALPQPGGDGAVLIEYIGG